MIEPTEAPEAVVKTKSRKRLVIVALAVVLAAGGGGAFWYTRTAAAPATDAPPAHSADRGAFAFDPFVVNLADPNASRFLRITVHILVDDAATAARVKENQVGVMQARSAILELLTLQTSDRLATPDGKATLKKAIVDRIFTVMDGLKVVDVLFSDFVIQF
jgi:flagellar FliL protein